MKKLLSYNHRSFLVTFFIISLIRTAVVLALPYVSGEFIDTIKLRDWHIFLKFALLIVFLNILCQIIDYVYDRLAGRLDSHLWQTVTQKTQENLAAYDMKKEDLSTSTIMQQLGQNFEIVSPFFYDYPISIVLYGVRAIVILAILSTMSWQLALMVGLFIPVFILFSERYAEKLSTYNQNVVDDMQAQRDYLSDSSQLAKMTRFLGASPLIDFKKMGQQYAHHKAAQVKITAFFENFLSYSFLNLMIMLASIISAYQVFVGQMTIGQYFAVQLYVSQFWTPVEYFLNIYQSYISSASIINSFVDFLNPSLKNMSMSLLIVSH
ncbi:ABC transporter transmembrane domain-containing protein [Streptococcus marmotae]|uniref:ABC transporter transmembrane domain-containing protein n=1 Tax=Streptococcus marmotae TaxID=1825069 RepID=UPI00082D6C7E|nr:ABC transporter transmembrane domain-containing protein [Streptococcus marmotae]